MLYYIISNCIIYFVTGGSLKDLTNLFCDFNQETWERDLETKRQRPIETCQWSECGV